APGGCFGETSSRAAGRVGPERDAGRAGGGATPLAPRGAAHASRVEAVRMRITALGRIAAEAFTWQGPDPKLSLVVKASFRIEPSGLVPSDEVIAVQDEVPARRDRELRYGSDYVPWKGRPEILLVGQARAMVATRCIPVRVALGEVDKRCFALTGAEATS